MNAETATAAPTLLHERLLAVKLKSYTERSVLEAASAELVRLHSITKKQAREISMLRARL